MLRDARLRWRFGGLLSMRPGDTTHFDLIVITGPAHRAVTR